MSALPREALEESPLADLHVIASEMGLDGYRRLRKAELIDRILGEQNDEILSDLGFDTDEIDHLRESGIIGTRPEMGRA